MNSKGDPPNQNARLVILEVKTSRTGEETPEAMVQFLSSFINLKKKKYAFLTAGVPLILELAVIDQRIHFSIALPAEYQSLAESQLIAQYPKVLIQRAKDHLPSLFADPTTVAIGQLKLLHNYIYPIRTTVDFKDIDPL